MVEVLAVHSRVSDQINLLSETSVTNRAYNLVTHIVCVSSDLVGHLGGFLEAHLVFLGCFGARR